MKHPAAADAREHDVERLGSRYEDVRRLPEHPRSCRRRCVTGANSDTDLRENLSFLLESSLQLGKGRLEVPLDVVVERLERRDVEKVYAVHERRLHSLYYQRVELPQKRGQRLSRAGWSEDQSVTAACDRRPSHALWLARLTESLREPFPDYGMKSAVHDSQNPLQLRRSPL